MERSIEERWAIFVARGGSELVALQEQIAAAIMLGGYMSAEDIQALVEAALDRFEKDHLSGPSAEQIFTNR